MYAADMFSRRKMSSKMRLTDVVPAPEEPVIEMIGWRTDTNFHLGSEQAAGAEERLAIAVSRRIAVVAFDAFDVRGRPEDQRHALVQAGWLQVEDAIDGVGGETPRLLDHHRDRVGVVDEAQATLAVPFARVGRIEIHAAPHEYSVRLGHHRGDPAHVVIATEGTGGA